MVHKSNQEYLFHFIDENQRKLYRFAYSYVRNEEDAKDILQNSILKACHKISQLRDTNYLSSWFYRVLINECLSFMRKRKQFTDFSEMDIYPTKDNDILQKDLLYGMILKLDDKSRCIITLRFFEDKKLSEISEIMDMPLSSVKNHLYKSLEDLRIDMAEDLTL